LGRNVDVPTNESFRCAGCVGDNGCVFNDDELKLAIDFELGFTHLLKFVVLPLNAFILKDSFAEGKLHANISFPDTEMLVEEFKVILCYTTTFYFYIVNEY